MKKQKIPQKYAHEQVNHKKNKPQTHEELRSLDTINVTYINYTANLLILLHLLNLWPIQLD